MLEWLISLDRSIVLFVQGLRQDWLNPVMSFFSYIGNSGIVWILICLVLIITKKYRRAGVMGLITLALCAAVSNLCIKTLVARARPFETIPQLSTIISPPKSFSFPSGHACSSFAVAHTIFLARKKNWEWSLYILASLISISRVYVGVHYLSDVLCGAALGMAMSGFIVKQLRTNVKWFQPDSLSM